MSNALPQPDFLPTFWADVAPHLFPKNLEQRIRAGANPISIWLDHSFASLYSPEISHMLGMSEQKYLAHAHHPDEPFVNLPAADLLKYCVCIGMHPAYFAPLHDDPRLALPRAVLGANIRILESKSSSSDEKDLALRALYVENLRYQRLVRDKEFQASFKLEGVARCFQMATARDYAARASKAFKAIAGGRPEYYQNLAPLMIEGFIVDRDNKRRKAMNKVTSAEQNLAKTAGEIELLYCQIFGDFPADKNENSKEKSLLFVNDLEDGLDHIPGRLASVSVDRTKDMIYAKISSLYPHIHLSPQFMDGDVTEFARAICKRWKDLSAIQQAQDKYDYNEYGYEADVDVLIDLSSRIQNVSHLGFVRRLVANQSMIGWAQNRSPDIKERLSGLSKNRPQEISAQHHNHYRVA